MSKDIRSFFKPCLSRKPAPVVNLSDDDVIPESPDIQVKTKKKETKKRRFPDDSSYEDIPDKKSKLAKPKTTPSSKNKKPEKPKPKEINASDIFGKEKVKRTEPLLKSEKKKLKTETGIHSDEDLEKTLLELDDFPVDQLDSLITDDIKPTNEKESKIIEIIESSTKNTEKGESTNTTSHNKLKLKKNDKTSLKDDSTKTENHDKLKINKSETEDNKLNLKNTKSSPKTENHDKLILKKAKNSSITEDHGKLDLKKSIKLMKTEKQDKLDLKTAEASIKIEKTPIKENGNHRTVQKIKEEIRNDNKKIFSQFIDDSDEKHDNSDDHEQTNTISRKRKLNKTLNESVISDEERYEKKRHSAVLYQSYLNRSGPKHLGSKEIPQGAPDCLKDCAFLLTGVLDSFEREEVMEAITKHGGCVKNSMSKKVTHVLAGDEAGPAKLAKAQELNIKIINEDDFLKMFSQKNKHKSNPESKRNGKVNDMSDRKDKTKTEDITNKLKTNETLSKKLKFDKTTPSITTKIDEPTSTKVKTEMKTPIKMKDLEEKVQKSFYGKKTDHNKPSDIYSKKENTEQEPSKTVLNDDQKATVPQNKLMWVEKYKPQNVKQIIGQHGDASNVKKLMNWLTKWYVNRKEKLVKPSPWAKNDDGAYFKAALLSGPPGVGKTTTVSLVCKEMGFDLVEFNASDTRSKTLINQQISELLTTSTLSGFAKGNIGKNAVTKKHVLVMDEVDGMAGNEDRGGLQTLISLIKTSAVPIICMCNDRNSQKMRSLVNYCYDLKFSKPRVDQIKSAMLSVCFKEGIKISGDALTQIIVEANQDVRQILNSLSMWSINCKQMDNDQVKRDANSAKKDIKLGPWEVIRKVFSAEDHKTMSIHDKSDLFFYDYSIAPLFVQENYLNVTPHCPKNEILSRVSEAADSISMADVIEKKIRTQNAWNLLPDQAILSSVIPGHVMSGHMSGQIQFPGWLGKNSSRNKMHRLCQEIHAHTRLTTSGSKSSIFLDYCTHIRNAIISPLIKNKVEGIPETIEVLQSYNLLREDLDSLTTLSLWPGQRDPMVLVDSKVKAAMTRTYNKEAVALPYAPAAVKKSRAVNYDDDENDDDELEDDNNDDTDPENDAMIKKKKKVPVKEDTRKPGTSKGPSKKGKKKS